AQTGRPGAVGPVRELLGGTTSPAALLRGLTSLRVQRCQGGRCCHPTASMIRWASATQALPRPAATCLPHWALTWLIDDCNWLTPSLVSPAAKAAMAACNWLSRELCMPLARPAASTWAWRLLVAWP